MNYEIEVRLDDAVAPVCQVKDYFAFLDKYDACGIGHESNGTSSIFLQSDKPLSLEKIAQELDDIEVIALTRIH